MQRCFFAYRAFATVATLTTHKEFDQLRCLGWGPETHTHTPRKRLGDDWYSARPSGKKCHVQKERTRGKREESHKTTLEADTGPQPNAKYDVLLPWDVSSRITRRPMAATAMIKHAELVGTNRGSRCRFRDQSRFFSMPKPDSRVDDLPYHRFPCCLICFCIWISPDPLNLRELEAWRDMKRTAAGVAGFSKSCSATWLSKRSKRNQHQNNRTKAPPKKHTDFELTAEPKPQRNSPAPPFPGEAAPWKGPSTAGRSHG